MASDRRSHLSGRQASRRCGAMGTRVSTHLRGRHWFVMSTLFAVFGCTSHELPEVSAVPDVAELVKVTATMDVAVDPYVRAPDAHGIARVGDYTKWLLSALRSSGLFRRVDLLSDMTNPALVAHIEAVPPFECELAFLASFTLGIIPEPMTETRGYAFTLHAPTSTDPPVTIDCLYRGTTWCGWVTGLRNFAPGYSNGEPEEQARFREFVLMQLKSKIKEVAALAPR
jgi:hypothetical protein